MEETVDTGGDAAGELMMVGSLDVDATVSSAVVEVGGATVVAGTAPFAAALGPAGPASSELEGVSNSTGLTRGVACTLVISFAREQ